MVDGFDWICTGVYGLNIDGLRDALWTELDSVRGRWNVTWCVFGDFNIIRYPAESLDCTSFSPAMFKFSDFIERNFLVDIPLVGGEYTWFRDSENPSMSRMDRVLVSADCEDHFLNVTQRPLPRVISNHCLLLVEAGGMLRGKTSFKFENIWLKMEGFVDLMRGWWNGYHFVGSPSYVLACKLKALKGDLKHWNKHVFGDESFRKKCLLAKLLDLDLREGMQSLSLADSARRVEIKADIEYLAPLEDISWRQKSKALYLKEGDNNTRFFHRLANSHRCINAIVKL